MGEIINTEITLEEIATRKAALKSSINQQKELITDLAHDLFLPAKPVTKADAMMQTFNTGLAVFDGVMLGMKVIGRLRKAFGYRRR